MYCIIGETIDGYQEEIGGDFKSRTTEEIVATFDKEEDAEEYIEKAKLKQPKRGMYGNGDTVFRMKTLLCGCSYAFVSICVEAYPPPHNPRI